jgi:flavin prenyltransferase
MGRYVVGVSGASGIVLALHLLRALTEKGHRVELTMSQYALYTASLELGKEYATPGKFLSHIEKREYVSLHANQDVGCAIASGSFATDGMIIIPCSVATLAAIAHGLGDNALRRAADVTLKEKRPLIIVPREAPLSEIHLENMLKLCRLGATIVPPVPAWYTQPKTLEDVEKFIVGKVLDALKIEHDLYPRWKS